MQPHPQHPSRTDGLDESAAGHDPMPIVRAWLAEAAADPAVHEATAMTLATARPDGVPAARMVLLKGIDDDGGFRFFTGRGRKALDLVASPHAALVLYWGPLERQVRVVGPVEELPVAEAVAYHASRPRGSRIAARSSRQSSPTASRAEVEARFRAVEHELAGSEDVPLPEAWGGFRVVARELELWHGRRNRLHDRLLYARSGPGAPWERTRLQP